MATNVLTANQSSADTALAWTAKADAGVQNTTAERNTAVFFSSPASTNLIAIAAGTAQATTGWRAVKNLVPGTYKYTVKRRATGTTPPSMKILTNCIDAGGLLTAQPTVGLSGTHTADAWVEYSSANFVVPDATIEGEAVVIFSNCDAGEANYFDDLVLVAVEVAKAGADQTVDADATVTLVGTPAGGTWAQENGPAVTLSAAVTNTTDTRVTFTASNDSTTTSSVREFRYTSNGSFDIVSITTKPTPVPVSPGSGYYHNLGTGYVAMDLWIGEVPANLISDKTFESNPIGEGVPLGWEGLFGLPDAEGASYSVNAAGLGGTHAARLTVGNGAVRTARLNTIDNTPSTPGTRVRVVVFAKASDATNGYLTIGTLGNVANGSSEQFKLTNSYQAFEFFWRVPAGNTRYNAAFTYGKLLDGTSSEVAPGSYMDIDSITVENVPDGVPALMRDVEGTKINSTTGRISDVLPWDDGGYPIVGIRRTRNDPTGTMGGVFSAIDPPTSTYRDFFNLAPGVYEFTTTAINEIGDGPVTTVTVDLSSAAVARDVTLHPYRGSWESGKAVGTWSHWNTPIGSGADLQPSGLDATTAGGKTISGTIRRDPIHIGYGNHPIKRLSASKKSDGTYYEQREPWKSGHTEPVHVDPNDTGPGNYSAGNSIAAFAVANDPTRVWQGHPLLLTAGGDPSVRYIDPHQAPDDLYGTGMYGAHGGSHTTALSCIRQWEWDSPEENAIQHAIGYNTWASAFLRGLPQGETLEPYVWPANDADQYWNHDGNGGRPFREQYYGRYLNPPAGMYMGALLTLPSTYTWSSTLALNTRKVLWTMKNFGLVIVDDSAWEVHQLSVERTVTFASDFHAPIFQAIKNLKVVRNNTEATPGGGGTPRTALVPDVIR